MTLIYIAMGMPLLCMFALTAWACFDADNEEYDQ